MAGDLILPESVIRDRAFREAAAFYEYRFGLAENFPDYLRTNPGVQPDQVVFAAKCRMDAPYPDVQHVLPILDSTLEAYKRGDPSVLQALGAELVEAHQHFLRNLPS